MIKQINEEIVPGVGIGIYQLGWSYEELMRNLSENYTVEERVDCNIIKTDKYMFWVNKGTNCISQITVYKEFEGKFLNVIGLGSTLRDIKQHVGEWIEEHDVYVIKHYPGICFELLDEDEWDELKSPIEFITVFKK